MRVLATINLLIYLATAIAPAGFCYMCVLGAAPQASATTSAMASTETGGSCCSSCRSSADQKEQSDRDDYAFSTSSSTCDCSSANRACCVPDDATTKRDSCARDGQLAATDVDTVAKSGELTLALQTIAPAKRERPPTGLPRFEFQILRI